MIVRFGFGACCCFVVFPQLVLPYRFSLNCFFSELNICFSLSPLLVFCFDRFTWKRSDHEVVCPVGCAVRESGLSYCLLLIVEKGDQERVWLWPRKGRR